MSHVDEGVLHAYLDGGLSALDAVRVERHVADCGPCRQRLDQARALISRAARLLEWASPPTDRAAPPLADLRPAPGAAPRWRVPVAWAATIVIALGAGIYGGRLLLQPGEQKLAESSQRDAELVADDRRAAPIPVLAAAESTAPRDEAKAAATPAQPAETERADSVAALNRLAVIPAAKAPVDTATARDAAVVVDGALGGARRETQSAAAAAPPAARPADSVTLDSRLAARPAPQLGLGQERDDSAPAALARARRAAGFALGTTWPVITRDSAARLLHTGIVALPDVPIMSVRATDNGVVVEHVLPPGQVIRLTQRRVADGEEGRAALGNELLARYIGGLRVEISGTLPADSLSRLLERVREMP